ncbi:MAG: potassium transporter TrkA [Campylobacteraceae bacterium]|nr:potassium transporter TrkA [Campylobacteraceae bacterium]
MKRILIIADGILAKHFLERVMAYKDSDNHYTVITYHKKTIPEGARPENFTFLDFDPTSFAKLSVIMNKEFFQVMILVSKKIDAVSAYENVRRLDTKVQVVLMDRWGVDCDDENLVLINSREVLAFRFADYLSDMPVIAQNVGLGIGEIMEIQVPIGSSYVYRHIASIQQKKWRIVAIYRNNALILTRPTLMIQPNDVLLTIGDPNVLNNVFRSVKQEVGRFPSPFGSNIYVILDMRTMKEAQMETILDDAMTLHSKINSKKLHVKVINPTQNKLFSKMKTLSNVNINISIDYFSTDAGDILMGDVANYDVGLLVTDSIFFFKRKELFYEAKVPVFKIGKWGFSNLKTGAILASDSEEIEKGSSVILDCCTQLDLEVNLYHYDPDGKAQKSSLVEHFENLSKLFGKEVEIIQDTEKNPLIKLQDRQDLLQFVPFHRKIIESHFTAIFSTDLERLSYRLDDSYQLFIPTNA